MAHFDDVILSAEQRSDVFQIDYRADVEFGLGFGHAVANDEPPGANFEIAFGDGLGLVAVQRNRVGRRLFAIAKRRFQNTDAARVAIEFGADDRIVGLMFQRIFGGNIPAVGADAGALGCEVGGSDEQRS